MGMEAKPRRNYRCPHYPSCLDIMALAGSTKTPCIGCFYQDDVSGRGDLEADLPGCIALLLAILADKRSLGSVRRDSLLHGIRSHLVTYLELIAGHRPGRRPNREKTPTDTILDQESTRRGRR